VKKGCDNCRKARPFQKCQRGYVKGGSECGEYDPETVEVPVGYLAVLEILANAWERCPMTVGERNQLLFEYYEYKRRNTHNAPQGGRGG